MHALVSMWSWTLISTPLLCQQPPGPGVPSQEKEVLALVQKAQQSLNADQRAAAAAKLDQFDGRQFPEVTAVLIQVLETDSDADVRKAAARALGHVRPTSLEALDVLQKASQDDKAFKVRFAARLAKLGYKPPPPQPTAPLPHPPQEKWSSKLTFWKKATPEAPPAVPQVAPSQGASRELPKPGPTQAGNDVLLLPPPPRNQRK